MHKSEKFWDRMSSRYESQNEKAEKEHIRTIGAIKKYLNGSEIVLDFGCATGKIATDIAKSVKGIRGIDISSKMIQAAKTKADEYKVENIYFEQSTIFDEKYGSDSFDVILAFNILHLVDDTQKVIQRMNELLKPGGYIISSTACLGDEKTFITKLFSFLAKLKIMPDVTILKTSELESLFASINFQIVETEKNFQGKYSHLIVAKKIQKR